MSISIKQAIDEFLLSCKVEGKSYGTIECYSDKLKGFLWYATNYNWPDDIEAITTNHLREFLAYLRETPHRFNSKCPRAMKPINSTTIQKYYRKTKLFKFEMVAKVFYKVSTTSYSSTLGSPSMYLANSSSNSLI